VDLITEVFKKERLDADGATKKSEDEDLHLRSSFYATDTVSKFYLPLNMLFL
jgi:hypothetical protein